MPYRLYPAITRTLVTIAKAEGRSNVKCCGSVFAPVLISSCASRTDDRTEGNHDQRAKALPHARKSDCGGTAANEPVGDQRGVTDEANRALATMIRKAVKAKKEGDKHGEHFVLGWRLYPNKDHPRWKDKDDHACGCGCGCSA